MQELRTRKILDLRIVLLNEKLDNILGYIKDNPNSDPNAHEMNYVMFEMADIGYLGREIEDEPYSFLHDKKYCALKTKFSAVMEYRIPQLVSDEQKLFAFALHDYFEESLRCMATLNRLDYSRGANKTRELFSSICGVNLFVHQQIRNLQKDQDMTSIIYGNSVENLKNVLGMEEYRDGATDENRPYPTRDTIVDCMYEEIQTYYQKSISDILKEQKKSSGEKS